MSFSTRSSSLFLALFFYVSYSISLHSSFSFFSFFSPLALYFTKTGLNFTHIRSKTSQSHFQLHEIPHERDSGLRIMNDNVFGKPIRDWIFKKNKNMDSQWVLEHLKLSQNSKWPLIRLGGGARKMRRAIDARQRRGILANIASQNYKDFLISL